ncbi:VCBS repeat-containing protein [Myxococcota bacterium]|nr:VCBS repeat-containing protein [Myxococcota bacterium]
MSRTHRVRPSAGRVPFALGALAVALPLASCGPSDKSIALIFPNEQARQAIVRVVIEAHSPDMSGAIGDRDCNDFLGKAKEGKSPTGNPVRGDYEYPFKSDQELVKVPSGRQIIYVLAFASREDDAPAILEGCSDRFDSTGGSDEYSDVPIELQLVIRDSARLEKVEGDRQVGREGASLAVKLKVRVVADPQTTGQGRATYVVPGVGVEFSSADPDFQLVGGSGGTLRGITGTDGTAIADVMLPPSAKTGEIVVIAQELDGTAANDTDKWKQTFSLSVTSPPSFPSSSVINGSDVPVGVALGQVTGTGDLDLVILSCAGTAAGCSPGVAATGELGRSRLTVIDAVGRAATPVRVVEPPGGLGVLPAGVVVADLSRGASTVEEIAVLNSRRADCQSRVCRDESCACWGAAPGTACPCEGSEVLLLEAETGPSGPQVVLDHRATLTSSNAVALAGYVSQNGAYMNLVIAAQGRSRNERPCSRVNRCLPYDGPDCDTNPELCGCPPGERCECPDCASSNEPGVCVARDKMLDVLLSRWNVTAAAAPCSQLAPRGACPGDLVCESGVCVTRTLFNENGCQELTMSCNNNEPQGNSECECGDDQRENMCRAMDACGCLVPDRIYVGDIDAPTIPWAVAAGGLKAETDWDLVVATDSGLGLVEGRQSKPRFAFRERPIINARMHKAEIVDLDSEVDETPDVVWAASGACTRGVNFDRACPLFREPAEDAMVKGCLGVYHTDGALSVFELRTPTTGGCRRYSLDLAPDGLCTGHFNADDFLDVAIASKSDGWVAIYSGDGRGGLLDPPERIDLPPGAVGGPITCGDVDGDQRDDVVVANQSTGAVYVLRTGS